MTYRIDHFINNEIVTNPKAKSLELYNPATGAVIGEVTRGTKSDVEKAVAAAKAAFTEWSNTSPIRRSKILFKFTQLLNENIDSMAEAITREHGKTLTDARGSIQRGIDVVEYACGIPNLLKGSFAEVGGGVDSYSMRQPLGVCAGITPFNFPAMIQLWMFPIAIACGNTFILKPSEKDPSVSLMIAELAKKAGLPAGVLNVVQGDKEVVDAILTHPDIKAVSFVGSTAVAEHVFKTATEHGKRVQAFGGAKNHCVIMPDADIEQAADAIVGAAYGSAGERCMAISVAVAVGDKVADELVERMKSKVNELKIGPGNADVDMGPLVTQQHLEKVKSYIDLGVKEGANLVVDGRPYVNKENPKGFYLGGCLFDKVQPNMRIYKEEIFGPVLCVVRVPDLNAALNLINEHDYGNGTAIFTRDGETAQIFANNVHAGMVGVNVPIPVPAAFHSFGGWKRSIFADIHMHGPEGVQFYTKLKTVTQRWPHRSSKMRGFTMPTH